MKLLGDYIKSRRGVLLFFALAAALIALLAAVGNIIMEFIRR